MAAGYRANSPDRFNPYNIIPGTPQGTNITMDGVPPGMDILGVDNLGNKQIMTEGNYNFPGSSVFEVPMNTIDNGTWRQRHLLNRIQRLQKKRCKGPKCELSRDIATGNDRLGDKINKLQKRLQKVNKKVRGKERTRKQKKRDIPKEWEKLRQQAIKAKRKANRKYGGTLPKDVHNAADRAGIKWDNNEDFMNMSNNLVGKEHIDDMTSEERDIVINSMEYGGSLPSYQDAYKTIPEASYYQSFLGGTPQYTNMSSGERGVVTPNELALPLRNARENVKRIQGELRGQYGGDAWTQDQLGGLSDPLGRQVYNDSNQFLNTWNIYAGRDSVIAGNEEGLNTIVSDQRIGPRHQSQPLSTDFKRITMANGGPLPSYQSSPVTIGSPYEYGWDDPVYSASPDQETGAGKQILQTAADFSGASSLYKTGKRIINNPGKLLFDIGQTASNIGTYLPQGEGFRTGEKEAENIQTYKNIQEDLDWSGAGAALDAMVALPFAGAGVGAGARVLKRAIPKQGLQYTAQHAPALVEQTLAHLIHGSSSKKGLQKGNEWLKNWIKHPTTQTKLKKDITKGTKKLNKDATAEINTINKLRDLEYQRNKHLTFKGQPMYVPPSHMPPPARVSPTSLIKQQQQYSPDVAMYPLKSKWKDFYGGRGVDRNQGVSYRHGLKVNDPFSWRSSKPNAESQFNQGTWLSPTARRPQSTTIHEGTHDWMTKQALERSGGKDLIKNAQTPYAKKQAAKYSKTRDAKKHFKGYLASPTEVHARIMELRRAFNLSPDHIVTSKDIAKMIKINKQERIVSQNFFGQFKKTPRTAKSREEIMAQRGSRSIKLQNPADPYGSLANLFNKLGVSTGGVVGVGALANQNKKYKKGGSLPSYQKAPQELPNIPFLQRRTTTGDNIPPQFLQALTEGKIEKTKKEPSIFGEIANKWPLLEEYWTLAQEVADEGASESENWRFRSELGKTKKQYSKERGTKERKQDAYRHAYTTSRLAEEIAKKRGNEAPSFLDKSMAFGAGLKPEIEAIGKLHDEFPESKWYDLPLGLFTDLENNFRGAFQLTPDEAKKQAIAGKLAMEPLYLDDSPPTNYREGQQKIFTPPIKKRGGPLPAYQSPSTEIDYDANYMQALQNLQTEQTRVQGINTKSLDLAKLAAKNKRDFTRGLTGNERDIAGKLTVDIYDNIQNGTAYGSPGYIKTPGGNYRCYGDTCITAATTLKQEAGATTPGGKPTKVTTGNQSFAGRAANQGFKKVIEAQEGDIIQYGIPGRHAVTYGGGDDVYYEGGLYRDDQPFQKGSHKNYMASYLNEASIYRYIGKQKELEASVENARQQMISNQGPMPTLPGTIPTNTIPSSEYSPLTSSSPVHEPMAYKTRRKFLKRFKKGGELPQYQSPGITIPIGKGANKGTLRQKESSLMESIGDYFGVNKPQRYDVPRLNLKTGKWEDQPYFTSIAKEWQRTGPEATFTATSAGGMGVGARLYFPYSDPIGFGLELDVDPTGPGGGILVNNSIMQRGTDYLARKFGGDEWYNAPGNFFKGWNWAPGYTYGGAEYAGNLPVPFVGATVTMEDTHRLQEWLNRPENESKQKGAKAMMHGLGPGLWAWNQGPTIGGRVSLTNPFNPMAKPLWQSPDFFGGRRIHNPISGTGQGIGGRMGLRGGNIIPKWELPGFTKYMNPFSKFKEPFEASLRGGFSDILGETKEGAAKLMKENKNLSKANAMKKSYSDIAGKIDFSPESKSKIFKNRLTQTGIPKGLDKAGEALYGTEGAAAYQKGSQNTVANWMRNAKLPYGKVLNHPWLWKGLARGLMLPDAANLIEGAMHKKGEPVKDWWRYFNEDQFGLKDPELQSSADLGAYSGVQEWFNRKDPVTGAETRETPEERIHKTSSSLYDKEFKKKHGSTEKQIKNTYKGKGDVYYDQNGKVYKVPRETKLEFPSQWERDKRVRDKKEFQPHAYLKLDSGNYVDLWTYDPRLLEEAATKAPEITGKKIAKDKAAYDKEQYTKRQMFKSQNQFLGSKFKKGGTLPTSQNQETMARQKKKKRNIPRYQSSGEALAPWATAGLGNDAMYDVGLQDSGYDFDATPYADTLGSQGGGGGGTNWMSLINMAVGAGTSMYAASKLKDQVKQPKPEIPYMDLYRDQQAMLEGNRPKSTYGTDYPTASSLGFLPSSQLYAQKGGNLPMYQRSEKEVPIYAGEEKLGYAPEGMTILAAGDPLVEEIKGKYKSFNYGGQLPMYQSSTESINQMQDGVTTLARNEELQGKHQFNVGGNEWQFANAQGNPIGVGGSSIGKNRNLQKIWSNYNIDNPTMATDSIEYNIGTGDTRYYDPASNNWTDIPRGFTNRPFLGVNRQKGGNLPRYQSTGQEFTTDPQTLYSHGGNWNSFQSGPNSIKSTTTEPRTQNEFWGNWEKHDWGTDTDIAQQDPGNRIAPGSFGRDMKFAYEDDTNNPQPGERSYDMDASRFDWGNLPTYEPSYTDPDPNQNDYTIPSAFGPMVQRGGYLPEYKNSSIHIKPENVGNLHTWAGISQGKTIPMSKKREAKNSSNPRVAAMGNFAVNAAGWKKQQGGQLLEPRAEIENKEVVESFKEPAIPTNGGSMIDLANGYQLASGPTHEEGGMDIAGAPGGFVFSDTLLLEEAEGGKELLESLKILT